MNDFTEYLDKSLPSNVEAEQLCLGSVLLNNDSIDELRAMLVPRDFYSPLHRDFYGAMLELHDQGLMIEPINIAEELKRNKIRPESYGGIVVINNLTVGLPHDLNLTDSIKTIKTYSVARDTIRMCNGITRDLLSDDVETEEVLARAENKILQLNTSLFGERLADNITGFVDVRDIADGVREQFARYNAGLTTGVKTGMKPLDDILDGGGLQGKASYLVAGMEKSGKTSLVLEWVRDIAVKQNRTAVVATLEMSKETMFKRLFSMHTGIPFYMFRPGFRDTPNNHVFTQAMEGLDKFAEFPIKIADGLFSMSQIHRYCTRVAEQGLKEGRPLGVIVIDYLQLVALDTRKANNREQEVSGISRAVKLLSSELDVPVVIISSLNRAGLSEDNEPDTHNLRDSQMLAYDAEAVMFVHNPAYRVGKPYEAKEITDMVLNVARQRNGPPKRIPLKFIGKYMSFMTEYEFNKHFNNGLSGDTPQSKGSKEAEQQEIANLWETDDDEWKSE